MNPKTAGIIDACRTARDALHLALLEAERAAAIQDLAPDDAAFVAARHELLQRIAAGLEKRMADAREATP